MENETKAKVTFHLLEAMAYGKEDVETFTIEQYDVKFEIIHWTITDRELGDVIFIPVHNIRSVYLSTGKGKVN